MMEDKTEGACGKYGREE